MFEIHDFTHPGDLVCTKAPSITLDHRDFEFFDAKGYRLNAAEQHFYRANDYHIDADFCNQKAWSTNWLMRSEDEIWDKFLLNHCFTAYRCNYRGPARDHLEGYAQHMNVARSLLSIRPKWGFELSLSYLSQGRVIEVINLKFDTYIYREFNEVRKDTEKRLLDVDWVKESEYIINNTDEWKFLDFRGQSNWKAKHLIGWEEADRSLSSVIV